MSARGSNKDDDGIDDDIAADGDGTEAEGEGEGEGEAEGEGENPFCQHIDDVYWLVDCSGTFTEVAQFSPLPPLTPEECPVFYRLGEVESDTRDGAIVEAGCDATCVRRLNTAVSYITCEGGRGGFDCYVDDEEQCGQMCRFPEGFYPSFEDFRAAHPCPEP
jgi:hypothetical protein